MTKMNSTIITLFLLLRRISSTYGVDLDLRFQGGLKSREEVLTHEKIVGGEETVPGRYPYQVGLLLEGGIRPFCGGTLIHPEWVLTAGHCFNFAAKVHIGRYDYGDFREDYEETDIEFQVRHPKYNWLLLNYDYALIKLSKPSNYTPVHLHDESERIAFDTDLTTMGWGTTSSGGSNSDVLREVELDYFPNLLCNIAYFLYPVGIVTPAMMCARRLGKDSCQGDSGGPLIIKGENSTEDLLVGVVSWGIGCANPFFPGVYARVSSAMSFIRDHISI